MGTQNNELIADVIIREWNMFDQVQNIGGRAACQDDWDTFRIMRMSQYLIWNEAMLLSYQADLEKAALAERNLISEKYAYMMERVSPKEYKDMKDKLPPISIECKEMISEIAAIQVAFMETFAREYPRLAKQARNIHEAEETSGEASYETYLKGELATYSKETLMLYLEEIKRMQKEGENLTKEIMETTVRLYGYKSLEEAQMRQEENA